MTNSFQCFLEGLKECHLDSLHSLFKNDFFDSDQVGEIFKKYTFAKTDYYPNAKSFYQKLDYVLDEVFKTKTTVDYVVFLCKQIINDNSPLNDMDMYDDVVTILKHMSDDEVVALVKRSIDTLPLTFSVINDIPDEREAVREFLSWDNNDELDFVKIEKLKDEIIDWGGIRIVYHPSETYQEKRCKNILDNIRRYPNKPLKKIVHDELVDMYHENKVYMDIDDLEIYDGEDSIFLIDKNEIINHLSSINTEKRELYLYKSSLTTTIVFSPSMLNYYKLTDLEFYETFINGCNVHDLSSMMNHSYDSLIINIGSVSTCNVDGEEYRLHRFVNNTYDFIMSNGSESEILRDIENKAIIINI